MGHLTHFITTIISLVFFVIVAATIIGAVWFSKKYKERGNDNFPWWKAVVVIFIEIFTWIVSVRLWPWIAIIGIVLVVIVLYKRKKKEEQIL